MYFDAGFDVFMALKYIVNSLKSNYNFTIATTPKICLETHKQCRLPS
jgi:hypothetical protein